MLPGASRPVPDISVRQNGPGRALLHQASFDNELGELVVLRRRESPGGLFEHPVTQVNANPMNATAASKTQAASR
jgi:hypothetical protein